MWLRAHGSAGHTSSTQMLMNMPSPCASPAAEPSILLLLPKQAAHHDALLRSKVLNDSEKRLLRAAAASTQSPKLRARFREAHKQDVYRKATALEALVSEQRTASTAMTRGRALLCLVICACLAGIVCPSLRARCAGGLPPPHQPGAVAAGAGGVLWHCHGCKLGKRDATGSSKWQFARAAHPGGEQQWRLTDSPSLVSLVHSRGQ